MFGLFSAKDIVKLVIPTFTPSQTTTTSSAPPARSIPTTTPSASSYVSSGGGCFGGYSSSGSSSGGGGYGYPGLSKPTIPDWVPTVTNIAKDIAKDMVDIGINGGCFPSSREPSFLSSDNKSYSIKDTRNKNNDSRKNSIPQPSTPSQVMLSKPCDSKLFKPRGTISASNKSSYSIRLQFKAPGVKQDWQRCKELKRREERQVFSYSPAADDQPMARVQFIDNGEVIFTSPGFMADYFLNIYDTGVSGPCEDILHRVVSPSEIITCGYQCGPILCDWDSVSTSVPKYRKPPSSLPVPSNMGCPDISSVTDNYRDYPLPTAVYMPYKEPLDSRPKQQLPKSKFEVSEPKAKIFFKNDTQYIIFLRFLKSSHKKSHKESWTFKPGESMSFDFNKFLENCSSVEIQFYSNEIIFFKKKFAHSVYNHISENEVSVYECLVTGEDSHVHEIDNCCFESATARYNLNLNSPEENKLNSYSSFSAKSPAQFSELNLKLLSRREKINLARGKKIKSLKMSESDKSMYFSENISIIPHKTDKIGKNFTPRLFSSPQSILREKKSESFSSHAITNEISKSKLEKISTTDESRHGKQKKQTSISSAYTIEPSVQAWLYGKDIESNQDEPDRTTPVYNERISRTDESRHRNQKKQMERSSVYTMEPSVRAWLYSKEIGLDQDESDRTAPIFEKGPKFSINSLANESNQPLTEQDEFKEKSNLLQIMGRTDQEEKNNSSSTSEMNSLELPDQNKGYTQTNSLPKNMNSNLIWNSRNRGVAALSTKPEVVVISPTPAHTVRRNK